MERTSPTQHTSAAGSEYTTQSHQPRQEQLATWLRVICARARVCVCQYYTTKGRCYNELLVGANNSCGASFCLYFVCLSVAAETTAAQRDYAHAVSALSFATGSAPPAQGLPMTANRNHGSLKRSRFPLLLTSEYSLSCISNDFLLLTSTSVNNPAYLY